MSAAEVNFPDHASDQPQLLVFAQAVLNTQAVRWNDTSCGRGLRWQIFTFNNGYTYKDSISNGCFFNLAARLVKYTGNDTYVQWADRTWHWMAAVGLLDNNCYVYDGTDLTINYTNVNYLQWTYNAGSFLYGATYMYNFTDGSAKWEERVSGMVKGLDIFFPKDNIMQEVACENNVKFEVYQHSFQTYLARWMAATTKLAPFTSGAIMAKLASSAQAAAQQCSGGNCRRTCNLRRQDGTIWDGGSRVRQEMATLEAIQSNLIAQSEGPVTNTTGGTSNGNYVAGTSISSVVAITWATIADEAGASFVTAVILASFNGMMWWTII